MHLFWALLIVATVLVFMFGVLPGLLRPSRSDEEESARQAAIRILRSQEEVRRAQAEAEARELTQAREELGSYFEEAPSCIMVDHAPKPIGACPDVRPQKADLPMADFPICYMKRRDAPKDTKLTSFAS